LCENWDFKNPFCKKASSQIKKLIKFFRYWNIPFNQFHNLARPFLPFFNKWGPKKAIFSTKKVVLYYYAHTKSAPSRSDERSGEVSDQYV
jgi:hypothetical protein